MDADRTIAAIAAASHGVLSRRQLLDAGLSPGAIDRRVARGLLVPVHGGVYRVAASPVTWHQRILGTVLAAGPGAVASHRAAGYLLGLDGIEPRLEVSVLRPRSPRVPGVGVHRLHRLPASDLEMRDGIPRTRPAATILALASVAPLNVVEAALDDALVRGLVSIGHVQRRLEESGRQGRRGAGDLAALLAIRRGRSRWTQSEFERRLFRLLRSSEVPLPVPQFEVHLPGGRLAYLDFAWPDRMLALEANSYRHHASRVDWARDNTRNSLLTALGWRILPVTWEAMIERPDELLALVSRAHAA